MWDNHRYFLDAVLPAAVVLGRLAGAGFDGFLIDDHVPAMIGDPGTFGDTSSEAYCSRGRAYAIGYLQGLLRALDLDGEPQAKALPSPR